MVTLTNKITVVHWLNYFFFQTRLIVYLLRNHYYNQLCQIRMSSFDPSLCNDISMGLIMFCGCSFHHVLCVFICPVFSLPHVSALRWFSYKFICKYYGLQYTSSVTFIFLCHLAWARIDSINMWQHNCQSLPLSHLVMFLICIVIFFKLTYF